ncbi:hypothetical protein P8452_46568 [Trifolium repens]|jgi:hypothetical protein|nr:hypothetical protein QL285_074630 [Trifolium repens]WJX61478.1 hypothetical protein P8452_46568 [Trifolium repens]
MEPEHTEGSTSCCFSTKKGVVARKKNGKILLSDMTTLCVKEQEKRLKKALEEEKKLSIEAGRVVKWVKQESSKFDSSAIKSIISDN